MTHKGPNTGMIMQSTAGSGIGWTDVLVRGPNGVFNTAGKKASRYSLLDAVQK